MPIGMNGMTPTRRSFSTPRRRIHDLPPEIVALIFQFALPCIPFNVLRLLRDRSPSRLYRQHELASFMLVCRIWRELALQTSALWSTLTIDRDYDAEVVHMLLNRSRTRGVILYMLLQSLDTLTVIKDHADRLIELHVSIRHVEAPSVLDAMRFAVPRLRRFSLCLPDADPNDFMGMKLTPVFTNSVTQLQSIHFLPYTGLQLRDACSGLTHIRLSNQWTVWQPVFIDDFLNLLATNPALEELELYRVSCFDGWIGRSQPSERIHLHNLRLLVMQSYVANEMALVLEYISIPRDAHLLMCDVDQMAWGAAPSFPLNIAHLENMADATRLSVLGTPKDILQLRAAGSEDRSSVWYNTAPFSAAEPRMFRVDQLIELWLAFPKDAQIPTARCWQNILAPMGSLQDVYLDIRDPRHFVDALQGEVGLALYCPLLRRLVLSDYGALEWQPLARYLHDRADTGAALENLQVLFMFSQNAEEMRPEKMRNLQELQHLKTVGRVDLEFDIRAFPSMDLPRIYEDRFVEEYNLWV
ncbi:hypothetical protein OBBRIDRAFT_614433 [Obba rivulosa]|uniref:F-box domain-containing protein n=1 Tax=Obba rivulosa TaxID=1052685 RepID=A0A8E2DTC6_9APHY|nr:hypothetical protein OBBRIDRAFT_614433 [Obba rivulosa]